MSIERDHSSQSRPSIVKACLSKLEELFEATASKTGNGYADTKMIEDLYWFHMETICGSIGSGPHYLGTALVRFSQLTKMEDKPGCVSVYEMLAFSLIFKGGKTRVHIETLDGDDIGGVRIHELSSEKLGRLHAMLKILLNQEWSVQDANANKAAD